MSSLLPPEAGVTVQVIGPAYLDEVVEVDGPLCPPEWVRAAGAAGPVRIDYSRTEAHRTPLAEPGTFLLIESPGGDRVRITDLSAQGGSRIILAEERIVDAAGPVPPLRSEVALSGQRAMLGGMGAGYALALGGRLVLPLGGELGREGREICRLLETHGIAYRAVRVPGRPTDTTLLIWSSAGDKLPIGRRTASAVVRSDALLGQCSPADITLVTSLPNATAARLVRALRGWVMFTPSLRNVGEGGLGEVAAHVNAVSMNRIEWQGAERQVGERCPLVVVTRGAEGASVRLRDERGGLRWVSVPAGPVAEVLDANHAGEAYAAGFLAALIERQWPQAMRAGAYSPGAVREAAWEGALAAALELGMRELAFPSRDEVAALKAKAATP